MDEESSTQSKPGKSLIKPMTKEKCQRSMRRKIMNKLMHFDIECANAVYITFQSIERNDTPSGTSIHRDNDFQVLGLQVDGWKV